MEKQLLFMDEYGDTRALPFFLIGFLIVNKTKKLENRIKPVREHFHFRNELKFSKISNLRFEVYRSVLKEFLGGMKEGEVLFSCLVVDKKDIRWKEFKHKKNQAYNYFCFFLLSKIAPKLKNAKIYSDYVARKTPSEFTNFLLTVNLVSPNSVNRVQFLDSKQSNLIQLTDIILGAINNDLTNNRNPRKRELRGLLLQGLGIKSFKKGFRGKKFSVFLWKPNENGL